MDLLVLIGQLRESLPAANADADAGSAAEIGALIVQLSDLITVAEAARSAAVGRFDAAGGAAADGGASTASWLRARLRLDPNTAAGMVHTARALRDLPLTAAAVGAGQISYQQAAAISALTRDAPLPVVQGTEAEMIVVAERTTPGQLRSYLARIRHAYAPQAVVRDEQDRYARRGLLLSSSFERLDALSGWLDPEVGAGLRLALEARLGPPDATDSRTSSQRWHDAFGLLVSDVLNHAQLPTAGGERPHLTVTVDLAALRGQPGAPAADLERYGPISGETARRLACDAVVLRAVLDGPSHVLDIGRATRIVPAGMRRALVLRDKGCIVCGAPASWCDAHHVKHWADGGHTKLPNLALLCPRHHRQHHDGKLQLHPNRNGGWQTHPPPPPRTGRDYALAG